MAKKSRKNAGRRAGAGTSDEAAPAGAVEAADEDGELDAGGDEDVIPQGKIVCALTRAQYTDTPEEQTLQSFIEQLVREYGIDPGDPDRGRPSDMERGFEVRVEAEDGGRTRKRKVTLAVFEHGKPHTLEHMIRAVVIAKANTKPDEKALRVLEEVLAAIPDTCREAFGLWTNGEAMEFRLRTFDKKTLGAQFEMLTDFPAPDESLEDLEKAERRPLRIATSDSLVRTFKRCHDYLYGNKSMDTKKAFWQLLQLIFCKIQDENQSTRRFFVGATEANTPAGLKRVRERIEALFQSTRTAFADVFEGNERVELNDRALAFVVGQLGRYNFLGTDADAKGLAYESITSTTLKKERGQFFTPRSVIRMMVEMMDPRPDERILDPACGSGGFLVVALNHVRRKFLTAVTEHPDHPVPREIKRIEKKLRSYAEGHLFGIDIDADLRKAARMNMVMNNDGHGNISCFNSLEYGITGTDDSEDRQKFAKRAGHGKFDLLFTNPPFGSKIPVDDPNVLGEYDLGHQWKRENGRWQRGSLQRKVAPEILFIEACCKYLKPGSGRMAMVLPDGILGNPGEQMEAVRAWMLREMELLASVDLPAEAFLPQVSVQASCVFLRRRHPDEQLLTGGHSLKQSPVFMAIAERIGHGRRGESVYVHQPNGDEEFRSTKMIRRWERDGKVHMSESTRLEKVLADDLPWIVQEYRKGARDSSGTA